MSISLDLTYVQLTSETDEYIRECETSAEDTTHGYKRKEAQAKAQGAYMLWLRLVSNEPLRQGDAATQRFSKDQVGFAERVKAIPTHDEV